MKKILYFLSLMLFCLSGCSVNITTQQENDQNKQLFEMTMKQECTKNHGDRVMYFTNSSFYKDNGLSNCKMDIFYSNSKNTCIGTYICEHYGQPVYGISDYLLKENLFYCKGRRIPKDGVKNVEEFKTLFNGEGNILVNKYSIEHILYDGEYYSLPIGERDFSYYDIPYFNFYNTYEVQSAPDICLILWSSEREKFSK